MMVIGISYILVNIGLGYFWYKILYRSNDDMDKNKIKM